MVHALAIQQVIIGEIVEMQCAIIVKVMVIGREIAMPLLNGRVRVCDKKKNFNVFYNKILSLKTLKINFVI